MEPFELNGEKIVEAFMQCDNSKLVLICESGRRIAINQNDEVSEILIHEEFIGIGPNMIPKNTIADRIINNNDPLI